MRNFKDIDLEAMEYTYFDGRKLLWTYHFGVVGVKAFGEEGIQELFRILERMKWNDWREVRRILRIAGFYFSLHLQVGLPYGTLLGCLADWDGLKQGSLTDAKKKYARKTNEVLSKFYLWPRRATRYQEGQTSWEALLIMSRQFERRNPGKDDV